MTISVWRYSHLALAVSSFLFITLAAVTGVILAFQPIGEKFPSYKADHFKQVSLAQAIPAIKNSYEEITELSVDANEFVIVDGIDTSGENIKAYVDPASGKPLGPVAKKSDFFEWVTALHRSLFLHEAGRFFVGLTSFLLLLIAVSGTILVIQRQRGWKRFFSRIVKESFSQYYHVVVGRLSLIPIIIIAFTGTYLSLERFGLIKEKKIVHQIDFDYIASGPAKTPADFAVFKNTRLADVQSIEFPFSDDPEDYYTLTLRDREIVVNQFTGDILSEVKYPATAILTKLSLDLHTGRTSVIWAITLAIASVNILFFIYSGFIIFRKRTKNRIRNKYKADESRFIILVGSENGATLRFANALHQQLISIGESVHVTELNKYKLFPKAEQLIVITATYGLGDAPSNANRFVSLLKKYPQTHTMQFSVLGFGSPAYDDFCRFAFDVNNLLSAQPWAKPLLEIHTVSDKSPDEFAEWFGAWKQMANLPSLELPTVIHTKPGGLQTLTVTHKTNVTHTDGSFIIKLQPGRWTKFSSGDLLAIYPANDHRERLYSIGKMGKEIQLSVKLHPQGIGSSYLYQLLSGQAIQARIQANPHFQFPANASAVVLISNGTGIAPFLGMIDENDERKECHLYCGFRSKADFEVYGGAINAGLANQKLKKLNVAYSREGEKEYVKDLLVKDAKSIMQLLSNKGVIMLCGSLSMQKDVTTWLEEICAEQTGKGLSYYQSHGQVLMDCY